MLPALWHKDETIHQRQIKRAPATDRCVILREAVQRCLQSRAANRNIGERDPIVFPSSPELPRERRDNLKGNLIRPATGGAKPLHCAGIGVRTGRIRRVIQIFEQRAFTQRGSGPGARRTAVIGTEVSVIVLRGQQRQNTTSHVKFITCIISQKGMLAL